ncbi:hypothetical protein ABIA39_001488 [Nocardia sp. GAS34]|uniref:tetratricopeptide repeat protein n=1 Tax=unclassified Nocardia TaxID=2637762 RepID=UPI003D1AED4F
MTAAAAAIAYGADDPAAERIVDHGRIPSMRSSEFGPARGDFGVEEMIARLDGMFDGRPRHCRLDIYQVVATLPAPEVHGGDASSALLANLPHTQPRQALDLLRRIPIRTERPRGPAGSFELEAALQMIRVLLELGETSTAHTRLEALRNAYLGDWRISWYTAVAALLCAEYRRAYRQFDIVRVMLPHEYAPSLAMAVTAEMLLNSQGAPQDIDDWRHASIDHYRHAWGMNRTAASAAFGLARRLAAHGDFAGAVAVLDELPAACEHRDTAGLAGCILQVSAPVTELSETDLRIAAGRLAGLSKASRYLPTRIVLLWTTLVWLRAGGSLRSPETSILGTPNTEAGLRCGLEAGLRTLARNTTCPEHRIRLVDLANQVRPRTWF